MWNGIYFDIITSILPATVQKKAQKHHFELPVEHWRANTQNQQLSGKSKGAFSSYREIFPPRAGGEQNRAKSQY